MRKFLSPNLSEITIYVIIWLFILAELVFVSTGRSVTISDHMLQDGLKVLPIFVLFIINTLWLVPNLLFEKKTILYIGCLLLLSILFVYFGEVIFSSVQPGNRPSEFAPSPMDHRPPDPAWANRPSNEPPHDSFQPMGPHPFGLIGLGFFNQIILCLLIIGLNTAVKVTVKWYKDEQARREIEKDFLKSELAMLQNQISPHFFMNTLNNIHALIDINSKTAQLSIVQLSKMMRYLLYESDQGTTTLRKEIEFIHSFVDLMKLRIDESVSITLTIPEKYDNLNLPPLLLMPFIENAFKHGVSYQEQSFINISLEQVGQYIIFRCSNRKHTRKQADESARGIGLKNVKKRLDLIFGNTYSLIIDDSGFDFLVKLIIPVHED